MNTPIPFRPSPLKLAVQAYCYALLFAHTGASSVAHANPTGGEVVGGNGTISQSGNATTINQSSQNMAINWQSYNLNANEQVQYIQPNAASISLNSILSNNGSVIAGRIDANGRVILVNPNGIFFTPTASLNVGSLIASGLSIAPTDFMNGNYVFNEIAGSSGAVVNSGLINASIGGNVALIGKQVENQGLIVANLGSVTLAAGKEAVLTFDSGGVLGVRVSQEILQSELGVDPAVINSGSIQAQGGRVLLTASQSQDVFSRAVNSNGIEQATSVVVNDDGSFTLGGADVLNSGAIDTSTTSADQSPGRIVLIGENVTSSGTLNADAALGNGGEIELHANDMTLLTQNSVTSARSEANGNGGIVKVLGDKVGLFDQSTVDVSGANGGGQALIGGDFQGKNGDIRNAAVTLVDRNASIYADALENGNGGKVILWADDTTKFLGNIFARGGTVAGDGGFVETSGKLSLLFDGLADRSAVNGESGTLLLDPNDITISDDSDARSGTEDNYLLPNSSSTPLTVLFETSARDNVTITNARLVQSLALGTVELQARRDITITGAVDASGNTQTGTSGNPINNNLVLRAGDDVNVNNAIDLNGGNLTITSGVAVCPNTTCSPGSAPDVVIDGSINTTGAVTINAAEQVTINRAVSAASVTVRAGDGIFVDASGGNSGSITANGNISLTAGDTTLSSGPNPITIAASNTTNRSVVVEGDISTNGGDFTASAVNGYFDNWFGTNRSLNAGGGHVSIATGGGITSPSGFFGGAFLGDITAGSLSVTTTGAGITQSTLASQNLDIAGTTSFNANTHTINLQNNSNRIGGTITLGPSAGTGGSVVLNNSIATVLGTVRATTLTVNADRNLTLTGPITTTGATDLNFGIGGGSIFTINPGVALSAPAGLLTIDGNSGNDTFRIGSSVAGAVNGNDGNDTFNITAANVNVTELNGGAGSNTLAGNDQANSWRIAGADAGTLNAVGPSTGIAFAQIQNLTGNNNTDTFIYARDVAGADGRTSGTVNGAGGADTVDQSALAVVDIALDGANGFTNIEAFVGNNTNSTLTGANTTNNWNITALNTGTVNAITSFSGFNILTGGSGTDNFALVSAGDIGLIHGADGLDSLAVSTGANTWNVTAANGGNVTALTPTSFDGVENLAGGLDTDTFIFGASGSLSGTLNGGLGTDSVNLSALSVVNVALGASNFSNVEQITGNGTNSTLTGDNAVNSWELTGANDGSVNGITFTDFNNLVGNSNIDSFVFNTGSSVTGYLDGAAGADSVTLAALTTADVNLSNGAYRNIEQYIGNNSGAFAGNNTLNTWTLTGQNQGTVNGISFTNFSTVIGGNTTDNFTFAAGASLTGYLDGAAGISDSVDLAALPTVDVTLGNGVYRNIESYTGNNTASTLTGENAVPGTWTITGQNDGGVNGIAFVNFNNIVGGSGNDTVTFSGAGNLTGFLDGSTGTDSVNLAALSSVNVTLGNGVYRNVEQFTGNNAASTLTGDNTLNAWTLTGDNDGTVNGIAFFNFNNVAGGNTTDTFTFNLGSSLTGTLNGGLGTDVVDMAALSTVNVTLGASGFSNVEQITGNNAASTLTGNNTVNTWTLTGDNDGTVNGTTFVNFNNLIGGSNADNFSFNAGSSLTGFLNGGAGTDTVNMAALSTVNVTLGASGFSNIEQITGNNTASTLTGNNTANTWTLTGTNDGSVGAVTFIDFNNLIGGNANDSFTFNAGSSLTGTLNGGLGTDSVNMAALSTVNVTLGASGFSNIEQITGNNTASTLTGENALNSWTINGNNDGTVNGVAFLDFNNLVGGNTTDTYTFNLGGGLTGTLNGGLGTDSVNMAALSTVNVTLGASGFSNIEQITGNNTSSTITGDNTANTWTLTGVNDGNVNGTTFVDFNNIIGGSATDAFAFTSGGRLTGSLNGGQGTDSLNMAALATVDVTLGASGVSNVEQITGNNSDSTLTADNIVNSWNVVGDNDGTVNGITFYNFNTLNGGSDVDRFTVVAGGSVDTINMGAGNDSFAITGGSVDTVNGNTGDDTFDRGQNTTVTGSLNGDEGTDFIVDNRDQVIIDVGTNLIGFEGVTAANRTGTINGQNLASTWTISGVNSGNVVDSTGTLAFVGFTTVNGGSNADTFNVSGSGSISGVINGNGGDDALNVQLAANQTGGVNFIGGAGADSVTIANAVGNSTTYSTTTYNAAQGGYEQIVAGNNFIANYQLGGSGDTVSASVNATTLAINGSGGSETIQLGTTSFSVGSAVPVTYANVANVNVNGQGGTDRVNLNNLNLGNGNLSLTAEEITATGTLTANTLLLSNTGQFGAEGAQIATAIDTLQLANAGAVYIDEANGLNLVTAGVVNNAGVFTIAGTTTINTGNGGSLTLNNAANDFDTVNTASGVTAASITLRDRDSINGDLAANTLALHTVTGVGSQAQRLQTHTANLTVTNSTGGVYVNNDQALQVSITNRDDINLVNTGDVVVDRLYANGGDYTGPAPYTGNVSLAVSGAVSAYTGPGGHSAVEAPDIIAENLTVNTLGDFGVPARSISIRVNGEFRFFGARGYVFYYGGRPNSIFGADDLIVFSGLAGLSTQQLIEIESLEDVDPAIFTAVRNYYHEDVAIMMPMDQRFDALDEDEKEKSAEQPN